MPRLPGVVLGLLAGIGVLCATGSDAASGKPASHTVAMDGTQYAPATIVVKKGDIVTFVNKDPFPHTVTAAGKFDSGSIAADKKWTYRAKEAGEFPFICTLHPNMKGTLKVR